jgi:hypothetical protein
LSQKMANEAAVVTHGLSGRRQRASTSCDNRKKTSLYNRYDLLVKSLHFITLVKTFALLTWQQVTWRYTLIVKQRCLLWK